MSQPVLTCYECGQPSNKYIVDKNGRVLCQKCDEKLQNRAMRNNEYKPVNPCCDHWGDFDTRTPYDL
jgi:hypothetical protein